MKSKRQSKILEIIEKNEIDTQEQLAKHLKALGFVITQATVSRDIKELSLIKVPTKNGGSKYSFTGQAGNNETTPYKLNTILKQAVISVDFAKNLVVIKTLSGMAQAVAYVIDAMKWEGVLGTIAGDDTIMIVERTDEGADQLCIKIKKMIK